MEIYNRKQGLAVLLVTCFMLMALSPGLTAAQALPGHQFSGPFVDKLIFNVITGDDAQVLAMQNDEIDVIGDMVDPAFLNTLEQAEDIEVAQTFRNGYGYLVVNCDKYPLNITAFRRAASFALNKEAISDDVWEGLSVPQDSVVPQVNPFSIEGQLEYTYYEENIPLGNQILDDAGFVDIDEDGFREAPNGEDFDILVECAQSSEIAIEVGSLMAEALLALGIDARSEATDFYEYLHRLNYHGDFDMVFLGGTYTSFRVDWLGWTYWSEYADEPFQNFPMWRNSTYDNWRDQLLHSTDYDEVYEAAIEMQRIWVHSCPEIICYENILLSGYRTDTFEGHVNSPIDGIPGYWTNMRIHRKASEGGPFGGSFRWSNPLDIDTFNYLATTSAYANNINNMLWESMIVVGPDGNSIPWLAESWVAETHDDDPSIPDGYTRVTYNIIQNATWSDGTQLTAEDVAFSLNFHRDAPGDPEGANLGSMTAAYAPTTYQVVVEFDSESYWHVIAAGYRSVVPKHIFEDIGTEHWNQWNPDPVDPEEDQFVTSGPFLVTEYVAGEFTELTYREGYHYGLEHTSTSVTTDTGADNLTLAIVAGAVGAAVVILIGGYILLRRP